MSEFRKKIGGRKGPYGRHFHGAKQNDVARKPEIFELRMEKMVQGGECLARLPDGRICFVAGALPLEYCKVLLTFQKKDFTKGRVLEILEASPDRVAPKCALFGKCGGCSLQHLNPEKQAEYLERVERENFMRLAHAELPPDFIIHTGDFWGYRNRARVVSLGKRGFGFRSQESNDIVPFENCPVLTPALNSFLQGPAREIRAREINVFDNGAGCISYYYPNMPKSEFEKYAVSIAEICGKKIQSDASVFFQSNLGMLPVLVESVRKAVDDGLLRGETRDEWLIDLFSGVGFFAAILQDKFKKVTTVERENGCLRHAKVNLSECRFVENVSAPAEDWLIQNVVDIPATLIVDPPRTGLPKEALEAIVKSSVNRLIYVSCDPVTLARDYAKFSEAGFVLRHAEGFAFYPQTPHLEMMFVLCR